MKVLIINATYGLGSTGTIVRDIQEECLKASIDCRVAYAYANDTNIYGFKVGNLLCNKMHALLSRINGKQGYFSYISTLSLLREIDQFKPDVINIHNLHSNFVNLNYFLSAIAKRGIALVVTLHDCWYFTGGCFHFTNAGCSKWKIDCEKCPKKKLDIPAYLFDCASSILRDRYTYFGKQRKLHIVGVSDWVRNLACETVFKGRESSTIHNGLDLNIFHPTVSRLKTELGLDGKKVLLGPASKWLDPINTLLLNKVISSLDKDEILLLFGCKSDIDLNYPNVACLGFIRDPRYLANLYSIADLFLNCSREDTLSTINLEAQACGTPLITFDNTGCKETAHPKYSNCVPTGDADLYVEAIAQMRGSKQKHSEAIVNWIESNFEKSRNYKEYVTLFTEIIK